MNHETFRGEPIKEVWSFDTLRDIAHRRVLVEQGETQRVHEIDLYMAFINDGMADDCAAITYIYCTNDDDPMTRVYKGNEAGEYSRHSSACPIRGRFYGDKVLLDGDDVVVINTELGIGVTAGESVRMTSDLKYTHSDTYAAMVRKLQNLQPDTPEEAA